MFKRMILMNPDPAAGGGGATPTPAPAPAPAPVAPPPTASFPSATSLLKLPGRPVDELNARAGALAARQPASIMPKVTAPEPTPAPAPAPAPAPEPTPAPAPAPAPAPEPPKKTKIGNQEFTDAELEDLLARSRQPQPAPQPAPAPAAPAQDPNAVAAQRQQEQARLLREERAWTENRLPNYEPFVALDATEMEAILVGGAEGATALQTALRKTAAAAELNARKSIYAEMAPVYDTLQKQVQTLLEHQSRAAQEQAEARFFTNRTEYVQHADLCRQAAARLASEFPNEVSAMSEDQFFAEVAKQVDYNLTRQVQMIFGSNNITDWRQVRQQFQQAPAPAPAPQPAPAPAPAQPPGQRAPTPTPFVIREQIANPAQLPPVQVPGGVSNPAHNVQPPAVNAPAGGGGFPTGAVGNFHHDVNARMRGVR